MFICKICGKNIQPIEILFCDISSEEPICPECKETQKNKINYEKLNIGFKNSKEINS